MVFFLRREGRARESDAGIAHETPAVRPPTPPQGGPYMLEPAYVHVGRKEAGGRSCLLDVQVWMTIIGARDMVQIDFPLSFWPGP